MKRYTAYAIIALTATTVFASAKPLWDTYPVLLCRYDRVQFCDNDMGRCEGRDGAAVLTFDFKNSEVRSFASKKPFHIVGRFFYDASKPPAYPDINSVFAEGYLYSFGPPVPDRQPGDPVMIEGIAQTGMGLGARQAANAHMTCHPE